MVASKCQRVILKIETSPLPKGSVSRLYLLTFRLSLARKPLATSLRQSQSIKLAASLLIIQKVTTMTTTRMLFPAVPIRELAKAGSKGAFPAQRQGRTPENVSEARKSAAVVFLTLVYTKTTPGSPCARLRGKSYAGTAPEWSKHVLRQWQREPRMRSHKQDLTIRKKWERSLLPTVAFNCTVRQ